MFQTRPILQRTSQQVSARLSTSSMVGLSVAKFRRRPRAVESITLNGSISLICPQRVDSAARTSSPASLITEQVANLAIGSKRGLAHQSVVLSATRLPTQSWLATTTRDAFAINSVQARQTVQIVAVLRLRLHLRPLPHQHLRPLPHRRLLQLQHQRQLQRQHQHQTPGRQTRRWRRSVRLLTTAPRATLEQFTRLIVNYHYWKSNSLSFSLPPLPMVFSTDMKLLIYYELFKPFKHKIQK